MITITALFDISMHIIAKTVILAILEIMQAEFFDSDDILN